MDRKNHTIQLPVEDYEALMNRPNLTEEKYKEEIKRLETQSVLIVKHPGTKDSWAFSNRAIDGDASHLEIFDDDNGEIVATYRLVPSIVPAGKDPRERITPKNIQQIKDNYAYAIRKSKEPAEDAYVGAVSERWWYLSMGEILEYVEEMETRVQQREEEIRQLHRGEE